MRPTKSFPLVRRSLGEGGFFFLVLFLSTFTTAATTAFAAKQLYTCGMHPQIIRDHPGNCPICGMALVPIRNNQSASPAAAGIGDARAIPIDAVTIQRMNLKTGFVRRGPVLREFRTVGSVAYDESGLRDITTKYAGWIEKLFVDQTWTAVKAGEPLFEIYSPELYNAELNYLVALRSEGDAGGPLTRAALARLQLFDLPASVIAALARSRTAARTFTYRTPADGMVIAKMAIQGGMIKPGELIYRLADLSSVWVLAQIYEQDLAYVRAGQEATVRVTYGPEHIVTGRVQTLLPQVEEQTRTATARIVLPNPGGYLRPGMFVDVRFAAKLADDALLVPDLAVVRSGEHNTVFVARPDGSFIPREVRLGVRSQGDYYQVLSGLSEGERVVTSGEFMLDSESQLRDAIQKMVSASANGPAAESALLQPALNRESPPRPTSSSTAGRVHGMAEATMLPPAARVALHSLANTAVEAGEALAVDNFAAYQRKLPAMRDALGAFLASDDLARNGPLAKFSDALPDRPDIKAARRDFAYFSTALSDLARENEIVRAAHLHVFQCPMAPGIGTGRWLSRTTTVKNPFYGSAMLECGDEIE